MTVHLSARVTCQVCGDDEHEATAADYGFTQVDSESRCPDCRDAETLAAAMWPAWDKHA